MILGLFKRLFPESSTSTRTSPFPEVHYANLRRELEIVKHAREEGGKNLPDQHATVAASYEKVIDQRIANIANDTVQRLSLVLKSLNQTAQLSTAQADQQGLQNVLDTYETRVDKLLLDARPDMEASRQDVVYRQQELEDFRRKHHLHREAEYPESRLLTFALLFLIVVMETGLNGYFFSAGSHLGLLGGFFQAAIISLVNVALAGCIAWWPARWIGHRHVGLKLFGGFIVVAYLAVLVVGLWFLTIYRDAFTQVPDIALDTAIANFLAGRWQPSDLNSYLFFGLTSLFALTAFVKVLFADDIYPGYGRVTRRFEAAKAQLLENRETLMLHMDQARDDGSAAVESFMLEIDEKLNEIFDAVKSHNRLVQHWSTFSATLEQQHDALIAEYRKENRMARRNTPPEWFKQPSAFDLSPYALVSGEIAEPPGLPELLANYRQLQADTTKKLDYVHNDRLKSVDALLGIPDERLHTITEPPHGISVRKHAAENVTDLTKKDVVDSALG